jgi:hypothetical protein
VTVCFIFGPFCDSFFIPNGEADDSVELMFCYGFPPCCFSKALKWSLWGVFGDQLLFSYTSGQLWKLN